MQLPQRRFSVGKIVLVTLLAAATLTSVAAKAAVLTLTSHDLPPYSYPSGEGSADGIAVRAVQCSARLVGVPVNIVFVPWKRAQLIVKNGGADGFFAASHSAARDEYAVLSSTIAPQQWVWYLKKDSPLTPGSAEFKERATISSFLGANMHDWLEEQQFKTVNPPQKNANLLAMLLIGRIDAILANRLVMEELLHDAGQAHLVKSALALDKPLGIYFGKSFLKTQAPDYLQRWNAAISKCVTKSSLAQ
jgi:polar amino acid transport system substrate-binding protein